jgi:hypothetical protein
MLGKLKVAAEAMLVGSIGLIATVPLTTALATPSGKDQMAVAELVPAVAVLHRSLVAARK